MLLRRLLDLRAAFHAVIVIFNYCKVLPGVFDPYLSFTSVTFGIWGDRFQYQPKAGALIFSQ